MLKTLLRVVITVLLAAWGLSKVDLHQLGVVTRTAQADWLILGVGVYVVSVGCAVWRWQLLLRGLGIVQSLARLTWLFLVGGFFNMFLPSSIGGDVMKMMLLTPDVKKREDAISSVLLDRIVGLAVVIGIGLCAAFALPAVRNDARVMTTLGSIALVFVLGLVVLMTRALHVLLLRLLPRKLRIRVHDPIARVHASLASLWYQPRTLLGAVGASILLQLTICISVYCAGQAFNVQPGLLVYLALIPIALATTALPISINGLGVQDNAMLLLFAAVGVPAAQVLLLSLYVHTLRLSVGLLGGALFALSKKRGPKHVVTSETRV